jgi:uncharacterized protein
MTVLTFLSHASAALLGLLATAAADAASFDCTKARSANEIAICGSPELSALDSEMGGLWFAYDRLPFLMGMSGVRRDEALQFLQDRRACGGDAGCLTSTYRSRIDVLRKGLASGIEQLSPEAPAPAWPPRVAAAVAAYADQCRQLGGSLEQGGDRPNVLTGDINGDGIADYVLDTQSLQCSGSASAFCGNGGC